MKISVPAFLTLGLGISGQVVHHKIFGDSAVT